MNISNLSGRKLKKIQVSSSMTVLELNCFLSPFTENRACYVRLSDVDNIEMDDNEMLS